MFIKLRSFDLVEENHEFGERIHFQGLKRLEKVRREDQTSNMELCIDR